MPPTTTTTNPATEALQTTSAPATAPATPPAGAAGGTTGGTGLPAPVIPRYNYAPATSADAALQDLTNFQTSAKSPIDIYNEATTQLGIPDVRTRVTNLRKNIADTEALLSALPDSVSGRTSGSLVTEAQRQRVLATERAPLDTANASYGRDYNMASSDLNEKLGLATQQASLVEQGNKNIQDALSTRYNAQKSKEDEVRRREEADRAFNAQMKQIEAQQAQFAQQLAESRRQFNISSAKSNAPSAAQVNNQNLLNELSRAAAVYQSNIGKNANGAREQLINAMVTKYGASVDPKLIKDLVYSTYIPNSLENQNSSAAKSTKGKQLQSDLGFRF